MMLKIHTAVFSEKIIAPVYVNQLTSFCGGPYVLQLIQKSPPTTSAYIEPMSVVCTLPSCLFNIHVYIVRPSTPRPFMQYFPIGLSTKTLYIFLFSSMSTTFYPHSLNHSNNTGIYTGVQILIEYFLGSLYCLPRR